MTSTAVPTSRAAAIWRRTRVGALLVGGLALALYVTALAGSSWPVLVITALLAAGAVFEVDRMGAWRGRGSALSGGAGLVAVLVVSLFGRELASRAGLAPWQLAYLSAAAAGAIAALAVALTRRPSGPRSAALSGAAIAVWVAAPLPLLAEFWTIWGQGGLVALLVLSKIGDIAGYYAGNAIGRHHPFKRLSPGKTTEGCTASFVVATAFGPLCVALGLLPATTGPWAAAAVGGSINLAAQAGDLLESWAKRRAGVKDSSTWLGPSGGLLDVVDSLLLTVPVALATWPYLIH